jgi:hypothetical protein
MSRDLQSPSTQWVYENASLAVRVEEAGDMLVYPPSRGPRGAKHWQEEAM